MANYSMEIQNTSKLHVCEICEKDLGLVHMNTKYCKPCKNELYEKRKAAMRKTTPKFENKCQRCGKIKKLGRKVKEYYCGYCLDLFRQHELAKRKTKIITDCGVCSNMYAHKCIKVYSGGVKFYPGSVVEDGVLIECSRFKREGRKPLSTQLL